jgi:aerobic C4-dicarboxylate transport protein
MKLPNALSHIYVQVLVAVVIAITFAAFFPHQAEMMKPLGDGFIKLVKMIIAPIVFCTIFMGIVDTNTVKIVSFEKDIMFCTIFNEAIDKTSFKKMGKIGIKALIYFEILTIMALVIGIVFALILRPGAGMNINVNSFDKSQIIPYIKAGENLSTGSSFLNIIPNTIFEAFTQGEILPILFLAILIGIAVAQVKDRAKIIINGVEEFFVVLSRILTIIMKFAPLGVFGTTSYTVGKYGVGTMIPLLGLIGCFYLSCVVFILLVLGSILRIYGSSIIKLLSHIKDEIFLVAGTSSSESALPSLMVKMEEFGCPKSIVGLVIPAGYSFNLDGTCIYFTMAIIFVAQACNIDLSLTEILTVIAVLLITSKGAAGVTGSGFITLVATLSVINTVPIAGLTLILGIDRFMSEARALTNLIGNAVAVVVISKIESRKQVARQR